VVIFCVAAKHSGEFLGNRIEDVAVLTGGADTPDP
jgi:hypothetical protein